ncbi:MAG: peptidase S8 [Bdellovibrio sp.]|nr:MAG: peptidase S8 [Bdellovibrio sp.]
MLKNFKVILISFVLGLFITLGMSFYTVHAVPSSKISPVLFKSLSSQKTQDVLVKLKAQASLEKAFQLQSKEAKSRFVYNALRKMALSSQKPLLHYLKSKGLSFQRFYIVNMVAVKGVTASVLKELSRRKDVAKIYANTDILAIPELPTVLEESPKRTKGVGDNIHFVRADKVWEELGVRGEGIVVAGQDTGVEWSHPALKRQYRGFVKDGEVIHDYNWHDAIRKPIQGGSSCGYNSLEPCDDNNHGTHTIGTIVGDDGKGNQIGMAPKAKWIACRNMDAGVGRPTTYLECFQFFLAPYPLGADPFTQGDPAKAPHVMNNSWGCPSSEECEGDVLLDVLKALKAAGIFVVVSAGNSGPSCGTIEDTPAWHSADTFSVGAYDHRKLKIAGFSSRGPSAFDGGIGPDVVAPGVSIRSSVRGGQYQKIFWSGTSMAGPHVVGLVALMWSANPKLIGHIDETINLILKTTKPIPSGTCMPDQKPQVPNNTYGYGVIDAFKAVKAALAIK